MPELPEVETVKRRLQSVLLNQVIVKLETLHLKSFSGNSQKLIGKKIIKISRRAKLIRLELDHQENLLIHLKMTGQLIFISDELKLGGGHPTADWLNDLPTKHTRAIISFKSGAKLFFNDMRIFGWIRELSDQQVEQELDRFGPDAIDDQFTANYLQLKLKKRRIPIKQAIMLGEVVAGVGNIYASEALFLAGINPISPAGELKLKQLEIMVDAIKQVISEAIKYGGTTFDGKFVNINGLAGAYQTRLKVYGKAGDTCPNCEDTIKKIKIGNRGTYFCPECQK